LPNFNGVGAKTFLDNYKKVVPTNWGDENGFLVIEGI
jgi:hypothetical protein